MPDVRAFEEDSAEHLRLVIDSGHIGIWELDVKSGRARRNRHHDLIFGITDPQTEWTYETFLDHVHEEDRGRVDELQKRAIREQRPWVFECRIIRKDGDIAWITAAGRPLVSNDGATTKLIGHVMDISEVKEREERLAVLSEELNHRVRNMLAMIKSIVKVSSKNAVHVPAFAQALEGRVAALARTQDLFASTAVKGLPPSILLQRELAAFEDYAERVTIYVDDEFAVRGSVAQSLALAFHELITNATRHGALSNESGRVSVGIRGGPSALTIDWRETGGPPLSSTSPPGFGSRLIAGAAGSAGKATMTFALDGLRSRIELDRADSQARV